jgi:hypothetical protein
VINRAADKRRVIAEAARVLRRGRRFAVSDVIADDDMDDATRADMAAWTGCIAGALTEPEFRAGLVDVGIRPTRRVHEHASSAIIRARQAVTENLQLNDPSTLSHSEGSQLDQGIGSTAGQHRGSG